MSETAPTGNDHPLNGDTNERASNASLSMENERLRGELIELRRQLIRIEDFHRKHQQPSYQIPIPSVSSSPSNKKKTRNMNSSYAMPEQDGLSIKSNKPAVVLELPVTLRPPSPTINDTSLGNTKDHQSVSTTDERETVEPHIDIESHQSAAGLHHRLSYVLNTSNTNATATTQSTRSTNKTRRSELLIDDEFSSSSKDFMDEDDPLAESRGLIGNDSLSPRNMKNSRNIAAFMLERPSETSLVADGSNPNQRQQMSFLQSLADRAGWLIGLLVLQSLSSFILAKNESLLQHHTVIVQFLTMLVGAGGNAGNQASVGVVRGIAVGSINRSNAKAVLVREFSMGVALSVILGLAGFFRAKVFAVPWIETIAITTSLFLIVVISVIVGATLPLGMEAVGIDPAHSSTTIQVVMDITGVIITVNVSRFMLDSDFHDWIATKMSIDGDIR